MGFDGSHLFARVLQTRWLARAPIWLYRYGAGWLLGPRILMIEHVGRSSGEPRFVCLEVVERPDSDVLVVASGFGTRAQWYRNLLAAPDCHVSVGARRRVPARARVLSQAECARSLTRYGLEHPKAWGRLRAALEQATGDRVESLPMVELTLRSRPG